jgi:putative ABC transport system substrate-binding protein
MVGKWLEILKEVAPSISHALLMFNPDTSPHYYVYLHYVYLRSFDESKRPSPNLDASRVAASSFRRTRSPLSMTNC